jgi:undecaprenyl diphosphate synthase
VPPANHDSRAYAASVGLDPDRLPRHVAVIMDGNGRWAQGRGRPRIDGHLEGAKVVRSTVTEACKLGLGQLTLFCFSAENWKRPKHEVAFLMELLKAYLLDERELIQAENIRFRTIGRREPMPPDVLAEIDRNVEMSAGNTGLTLCLAINYGSRAEILDAVRDIATRVGRGLLDPAAIDESAIDNALDTAGMPDPDLLVRTAGEMRVSNYLLWQISYAELWVTPLGWPDFSASVFHSALADFARRDRRFGGLTNHQGAAL